MTGKADLVILNGKVLTMDPAQPRAEAVALAGGAVLAVGSTAQIRDLAAPGAQVIDAAGGTVMPGFIDSHVHLFQGSAALEFMAMEGVESTDAAARTIRAYAEANPDEAMILGTSTAYGLMDGRNPTRHDLDAILPDRPLALLAPDIHTLWANTKALERANLLHGGPVPEGSVIVMEEGGTASGELQETGAFGPVLKLSRTGGRDMLGYVTGAEPEPPATEAERAADRRLLAKGLAHAASHGITTMHNMDGNFYQLELLSDLDAAGDLKCRMQVPFHLKNFDPLDRLEEAGEMRRRYTGDRVWSGRVKMFMDGVMDTHTALMTRPYPGTDTVGEPVFEPDHFNAACVRADAMGLQLSVHSIGDLATRRTLDGYQAAREANGARDSRHRIEHIEVIHPDDLPRLGALGAVASLQPRHSPLGDYFPVIPQGTLLYDDQYPYTFAWQRIRETGAPVIFSTDWPVVPVDVMRNIQCAIAPMQPGAPWDVRPQSLMDTLASYTSANAWVEFNEGRKGQLIAGQMGDVVVLDRDLEACAPEEIHEVRVLATICGGQITYSG
ncbi:amidohydrolase [Pelagivirga sediminicola]|uniref:Amidohydrolase n=1 Tax=Pelagivirga sediminicola TaxID=2170575 RepID=A0A2T7G4S7_9RHOB|nr:amidohydrolase [Pelagivirga sediminicola]PVA09400.1 amidohydrolase [Pelagivirga sediminicola]